MTEELTEQKAQAMLRDLASGKETQFSFFTDVIQTEDTTRVGNLSLEELGNNQFDLRGVKELETFSRNVYQDDEWAEFFNELGQINTSTSLSKEGFLLRLAVTAKREMADTTVQERKRNKGWFKKK